MDAREMYVAGLAEGVRLRDACDASIRTLSFARLAVAVGFVGVVIVRVWASYDVHPAAVLPSLALIFLCLVVSHARAFARKGRADAKVRFYTRALARLDGQWRSFPSTGARYVRSDHPFAEDLDVFGPSSVFQLLDATETPFGTDALARALDRAGSLDAGEPADAWPARIIDAQDAVRELAPEVAYREALAVEGAILRTDAADPTPFMRWAGQPDPARLPTFVVALAYVLPPLVLLAWRLAPYAGLPKASWLLVVALELVVLARYRAAMSASLETVSSAEGGFARYGAVFAAALARSPSSPRLARALEPLRGTASKPGVVEEMGRLAGIVGFVDARRNEVFRLFIGPVLMWDVHCAARLDAWRVRSRDRVATWFDALGEVEALASLAGFAFDRADHSWPVPHATALVAASGVAHPLIDRGRRVGNDVTLPGTGHALVVTGSNMSGKSTLLRALGVNLVLAQVGAPVCATALSFGRVQLATSMRVKDSLEDGVSHFLAELQKLKRVVDLATASPPVLFLLDEILHGTNSRERIIGARAVVRGLLAKGALGAVSTHDLGIAELAELLPGTVTNVHFEEQVHDDGTMTFDYALRQGTVQSSNALRLMRAVGLDVPLEG